MVSCIKKKNKDKVQMSINNTNCVSVHIFTPHCTAGDNGKMRLWGCGTSNGIHIMLPHFDAMCNESGRLKTSIYLIIFQTTMG